MGSFRYGVVWTGPTWTRLVRSATAAAITQACFMNGSCGNQTASKPTSSAITASRTSSRAVPTCWTSRRPKRTRRIRVIAPWRGTRKPCRTSPGRFSRRRAPRARGFALRSRRTPRVGREPTSRTTCVPTWTRSRGMPTRSWTRDIDALRAAGYSDDAIFELTLAAALGAARASLDAGTSDRADGPVDGPTGPLRADPPGGRRLPLRRRADAPLPGRALRPSVLGGAAGRDARPVGLVGGRARSCSPPSSRR